MRNNGPEPICFWNHIGIQCSHVFALTALKRPDELQTVVQIPSLEVMRYPRNLSSSCIENMRVRKSQLVNFSLEFQVVFVVKNNHSKAV